MLSSDSASESLPPELVGRKPDVEEYSDPRAALRMFSSSAEGELSGERPASMLPDRRRAVAVDRVNPLDVDRDRRRARAGHFSPGARFCPWRA